MKKPRSIKPNPYLLLTGAVAASAAALLAQNQSADAFHKFEVYEAGVYPAFNNGKLYSDKEPGRPCYGQPEPDISICYMTLLADRSYGAESSGYDAAVSGALAKWTATPTTLAFNEVPYNYSVNDVHIKTADLGGGGANTLAITDHYDFHNADLNNPLCIHGDCNDPDGLSSHQPQRWWYVYIRLDTSAPSFLDQGAELQKSILAHEIGHGLGIEERGPNCPIPTVMDISCIQGPAAVRNPENIDICSMNHAGYPVLPVMYGDAVDPAHPAPSDPLHLWAYRSC